MGRCKYPGLSYRHGKSTREYWAARAIHESNGWQSPAAPLPVIAKVRFDDRLFPEDAEFHHFCHNADDIRSALEEYGVAVIRRLYSKDVGEKKSKRAQRDQTWPKQKGTATLAVTTEVSRARRIMLISSRRNGTAFRPSCCPHS